MTPQWPITPQWIVHPPGKPEQRERLCAAAGLHPLVADILLRRGIDTPEAAEAFLQPRLEHLHDPFLMLGMDAAVERIAALLAQGGRILVSGDYDVDGIASSALMTWFLRAAGAREPHYFIPNRFDHGYGLTSRTVDALLALAPELVITVDNGITALEEVRRMRAAGIEVIVTDHHLALPEGVPEGIVVNPAQPGCPYPFKKISGCGVAFKLITALRKRLREKGWWSASRPEPNLKDCLDLVAIATVADVVSLTGENRVLVRHGLDVLNRPERRPGLAALLASTRAPSGDGRLTARDIAFKIAPRLNAAGRMSEGSLGVELLLEENQEQAANLAGQLETENDNRRAKGESMFREAVRAVDGEHPGLRDSAAGAGANGSDSGDGAAGDGAAGIAAAFHDGAEPGGIVVCSPQFHEGIIGIIASRLAERYHRPALVVAENGGVCKGSARTVPGLNVTEAIAGCAEWLDEYGGHAGAAGCRFPKAHLPQVKERFQSTCGSLAEHAGPPAVHLEGRLEPPAIDSELVNQLAALQPFGHENEDPVFLVEQSSLGRPPEVLKGRHLKWRLEPPLEMFAWNMAEGFAPGERLAYRVRLGFNTYRGRKSIQLTVEGIRSGE